MTTVLITLIKREMVIVYVRLNAMQEEKPQKVHTDFIFSKAKF
jgi:hypothetical protein